MNESGRASGGGGKVTGKGGSSENCRFDGARSAKRTQLLSRSETLEEMGGKKATVDSIKKALIKDFVPEL